MISRILGRIATFFKSIFSYALHHKIVAGIVIVVVAGLGYWGYTYYASQVTTTQYVLGFARMAPIQETVTGSGQVASEHQLNLSPKSGGVLSAVNVKAGDVVSAGQVVATVDLTDANKSLRDASINLESARISYQQSLTSNTNTTEKTVDSAFTTNGTAFSDMNTALVGMDAIMNGSEVYGSYAVNNLNAYSKYFNDNPDIVAMRDKALASYLSANSTYHSALATYNATARTTDPATILQMTDSSYQAAKSVAQAAKDLNNYLSNIHQRFADGSLQQPSALAGHLTTSGTYVSSINGDVNALSSAKSDLNTAIQTGSSGGVSLTAESAQLAYQKAQNAYQDAKDNVENYIIRAPFEGTIASVPLQRFDQAGSGTTVAVLITKQQIATLSLNEVDAANVKAGQKVSLTFDAISGLTIDGTVAEVDTVGTVSQGVVSYTVKIGFDTQDPRILPGMTVNATIVTASKDSTLVVPSSAVKVQGTQSYVQVVTFTKGSVPSFANASSTRGFRTGSSTPNASTTGQFQRPTSGTGSTTRTGATRTGPTVDATTVTVTRVNVTTGIIGDSTTEITNGLTQGQFVVSQSLNSTGKTTTSAPSIFNLFGARSGATGGARTTTSGTRTTTTSGTSASRSGGVSGPPGG